MARSNDTAAAWLTHFQALCFMCLLAGCASLGKGVDSEAERLGFVRSTVPGSEFQHVIYMRASLCSSDRLHVYLEGDGVPWTRPQWVSSDPTPRTPLALRLMALDPHPSLYLGRPCYHGSSQDPPCEPSLWTSARYSKRVVVSLENALRRSWGNTNPEIVLIGYSGGGTLAMLLAKRLPQIKGVVTIAGNLDPDGWARYHGYSPLIGSLNPAQLAPLRSGVYQLHLVGQRDRNIPPALIRPVVDRQPGALFRVIEGFGHACCWEKAWPTYLKEVVHETGCCEE